MIDLLNRSKKFVHIICLSVLLLPDLASAFSAYSNKELDDLEKQFKQQINISPQVIRTPLADTYINHLARLLAMNGGMEQPHFFIVRSPEINAFAGPGGYIGVNSQLILASENESELAAVMAHEMAHVRLHHLYRMIEHQKQMQIPKLASMLAAIALGVINPVLGTGAMAGTLSSFEQDSISYVRSNEKEADSIGIDILSKANFDPHGMPSFFKKMQQNSRLYYTANFPAILRTHPLDEDRIAEADNRIAQLTQIPSNHSSIDYYLFKELIRHEAAHNEQNLLEYYRKECTKYSPSYACSYGLSLSYLELNKYAQAQQLLEPLSQEAAWTNNPYISMALAQAYEHTKHSNEAKTLYQKFYKMTPNNTAVLDQYSDYLKADDPKKALSILLKAHRQFKNDVNICLKLARTQAQLKLTAEAYFTEANCHLILSEKNLAIEQLNIAKKYAKNNSYMQARIQAKLDEIQS